ncbi:MAG: SRPBCC domain-containing protein [Asticcacaulis sp.]
MTLEAPASEDEVFKISRTFDASKALLWEVITKAEHLGQWFGPAGMKLIVKSLDLKVGGTFLYGMQMPNGMTLWGKWVFREINAPDSIAYVVSFCNEAGEPVRHPMAPMWPLEVLAIQTLTEIDGDTIYESRSYPINATPEERAIFKAGHASMQMGFGGTYMQLEAYLAKITS